MVTEGQPISGDEVNALVAYAQTKLKKTYSGKWLKKLNDIRRDAYEKLSGIDHYKLITSGPWGVLGGSNNLAGDYTDVFWIGPREEGRIIKSKSSGFTWLYNSYGSGGYNGVNYHNPNQKSARWEFWIGGDEGVIVRAGDHGIAGIAVATVENYDKPPTTSPPSISVYTNIPGLNHSIVYVSGFPDTYELRFNCDSKSAPGFYYIEITITDAIYSLQLDQLKFGIEVAVESTQQTPHGGINDYEKIVRMDAPKTPVAGVDLDVPLPFGVFCYVWDSVKQSLKPYHKLTTDMWTVTGSVGRWFAKTQPIRSREVQLQAYINPNTPPPPGPWYGPITDLYRTINPAKEESKATNPKILNATPAITYRIACHNCQRDTDPLLPFNGYQNPFWYIRKAVVRKLPVVDPKTKIASQSSSAVPFSLGCFRNGVYEPFPDGASSVGPGGATLDVIWPVFHQSPLVYQCTERLAVFAYVSWELGRFGQGDITFPVLAAHYNDTMNMLQLIE
jgi:hypothetical protein